MKTVQVILGPTASGKTDFSVSLAQNIGAAEIVNADSRQLYKYVDIGTAKITKEEMQGIPHHLLDVLDPKEESTVGWYVKEATKVIDDIFARNKTPILVGGSMLYISAIIDGLSLAPVSDPITREKLMKEYEVDAGETLHRRLQTIDPEAAKSVHQNNMPHLVRAIEICEITNLPKSKVVTQDNVHSGQGISNYEFRITGMQWNRSKLVERINTRTIKMFEAGWIEEVQSLLDRGYTAEDPAMKSHGYKEIMTYIQEGEPFTIEELQESIAAKSRQYAKRQMTWWRGDKRIQWVGSKPIVNTASFFCSSGSSIACDV